MRVLATSTDADGAEQLGTEHTVAGNMVLVCLGRLVSSSTADELVRPLGFMGTVRHLVVGLSLIGVILESIRRGVDRCEAKGREAYHQTNPLLRR